MLKRNLAVIAAVMVTAFVSARVSLAALEKNTTQLSDEFPSYQIRIQNETDRSFREIQRGWAGDLRITWPEELLPARATSTAVFEQTRDWGSTFVFYYRDVLDSESWFGVLKFNFDAPEVTYSGKGGSGVYARIISTEKNQLRTIITVALTEG